MITEELKKEFLQSMADAKALLKTNNSKGGMPSDLILIQHPTQFSELLIFAKAEGYNVVEEHETSAIIKVNY